MLNELSFEVKSGERIGIGTFLSSGEGRLGAEFLFHKSDVREAER